MNISSGPRVKDHLVFVRHHPSRSRIDRIYHYFDRTTCINMIIYGRTTITSYRTEWTSAAAVVVVNPPLHSFPPQSYNNIISHQCVCARILFGCINNNLIFAAISSDGLGRLDRRRFSGIEIIFFFSPISRRPFTLRPSINNIKALYAFPPQPPS